MKGLEKFEPDTFYHIVNHSIGNENLFRTNENYRYFLKRYSEHIPSVCDSFAYCLMPNHIHFLIKTHSEGKLKCHPKYNGDNHKVIMQPFSNLLNGYAKAYNKMYDRKGGLWMDFTKRFKIESDNYLTKVINYIHQNPVKHGFVGDAHEWTFSSFNTVISTKTTLLRRNDVINWFGNKEEFLRFHHEGKVDLIELWK